jgi:hypothetical protein
MTDKVWDWDCTPQLGGFHNAMFGPARKGEPALQPVVLPAGAKGLLARTPATVAAVLNFGSMEDVPLDAAVSGNGRRDRRDLLQRDDTQHLRHPVRDVFNSAGPVAQFQVSALEAARSASFEYGPADLAEVVDRYMAGVVRATWNESDETWNRWGYPSFWAIMRDTVAATGLVTNPNTGDTDDAWNKIYEICAQIAWRKTRGDDGSFPARLVNRLDRAGFDMNDAMHVLATAFTGEPTIAGMLVVILYLMYLTPGLAASYLSADTEGREEIIADLIVDQVNFAYAKTRIMRKPFRTQTGVIIPADVPVVPSLWARLYGRPARLWQLAGGGGEHHCPSLRPGMIRIRILVSAMLATWPELRVEASAWPPGLLSVPPHVWAYAP